MYPLASSICAYSSARITCSGKFADADLDRRLRPTEQRRPAGGSRRLAAGTGSRAGRRSRGWDCAAVPPPKGSRQDWRRAAAGPRRRLDCGRAGRGRCGRWRGRRGWAWRATRLAGAQQAAPVPTPRSASKRILRIGCKLLSATRTVEMFGVAGTRIWTRCQRVRSTQPEAAPRLQVRFRRAT